MFKSKAVLSSFSIDDTQKARTFYTKILRLKVSGDKMGLRLLMPGGDSIFVYPKKNHIPATFTVLNFIVDNIDTAYDELVKQGVVFQQYKEMLIDEKGIMRGISQMRGPNIAWFKDPAGNILSILQVEEKK